MANNLLGRVNNYGYEYGGEVPGYKAGGKVARAMKISKARKDIRKRARKMKKKARGAGIGSIIGELLGKGVKYIPGLPPGVGRALSPLVSGALAKYGAELGYGKRVGAGKDKWLSGYRDMLKQFETGTRGGFQERGYGAAIRGGGQELGSWALDKFGTTDIGKALAEKKKDWEASLFRPKGAKEAMEAGKEMGLRPTEALEDYYESLKLPKQPGYAGVSEAAGAVSTAGAGLMAAGEKISAEAFKEKYGPYSGDFQSYEEYLDTGILPTTEFSGYRGGGYASNSLLYRTFGNKSNLF